MSNPTRIRKNGKDKNFKPIEDQFIGWIMQKLYKNAPPETAEDYEIICKAFNDNDECKKFGIAMPFDRDSISIKRRIQSKSLTSLKVNPPSGSTNPSSDLVAFAKLADDAEFLEEAEKQRADDTKKISKAVNEITDDVARPKKMKKTNHFWEDPNTGRLVESLLGKKDNDISEYFSIKQSLKDLRDERIITEKVYQLRSAELAVKYKIINMSDTIIVDDPLNISL